MQYIRYHEMESLLKNYRGLKGTVESLRLELGEVAKEVDQSDVNDYIESLALRKTTLDEVKTYSTGHISDKTASVAMNYKDKLEKENSQISEQLKYELFVFEIILDKINIGFKVLPEETKQVIMYRYMDNLSWCQIESKLPMSKRQCQEVRKKGIEKLRSVSRITINQYERVMKILNLK